MLAKAYRHCLVHGDPAQIPQVARYLIDTRSLYRFQKNLCCRSVMYAFGTIKSIGP